MPAWRGKPSAPSNGRSRCGSTIATGYSTTLGSTAEGARGLAILQPGRGRNSTEYAALWGMVPNLSNLEIAVLRKLVNGETVSLSSQLRLRLELSGVIRDGAQGIVVRNAVGRKLAGQKLSNVTADSSELAAKLARDSRGRRLPFQRKSIF